MFFFFLMIRRPPRSTQSRSSAASDVYKRQGVNEAVAKMLERYRRETVNDHLQALREILQEVALLGLWRAKFFEHGAFYGGTALRILHGLDRFSEDLDFSLLAPDPAFRLDRYASVSYTHLRAHETRHDLVC